MDNLSLEQLWHMMPAEKLTLERTIDFIPKGKWMSRKQDCLVLDNQAASSDNQAACVPVEALRLLSISLMFDRSAFHIIYSALGCFVPSV